MCASHLTTVASHLTIIPFELLQIVLTVKGTANPLQRLVQPLLLFLKTLPSPIKRTKILQLNITSLQNSHDQLKFYQEQNNCDIIDLQEINVKDKLEIFRNWKRKFNSTFTEKKLGFGVATLMKNDIKSAFVNNIQSNLETISNLIEINGKQALMGNVYIPPSDSEMLDKLDLELGKYNDITLLLLGDFNARHPVWDKNCKAPNKNGKILEDIMSRQNVQIQNYQNLTYVHKRESSTIDLVLTSGIRNLECQTKKFDLINTCHKGIITTSQNIRPIVNNKKHKTKGAKLKTH